MENHQTQSKPNDAEQPSPEGLSSSVLISAGCCPACGSRDLTWYADTKNYGGVQDGRIKMNEVGPIFFLGCDDCSETIKIITGDVVALMLTEMQADNAVALAPPPQRLASKKDVPGG